MQRALMHYFKPYNRALVLRALKQAGREDLIGWGPDCLIPPYERKNGAEKKPAAQGRLRDAGPSGGRGAPGRSERRQDSGRRRTNAKHNDTARHNANGRKTR